MTEVDKNIYVGDLNDYRNLMDNHAYVFIQACKTPCHDVAVGNVDKNHPEYLVAKRTNGIVLNMIDGDYGYQFSPELFNSSLDFIYQNRDNKRILIHCNQGVSRSPSIALLYLAREGKISSDSYEHAKEDFKKIYHHYHPNTGVEQFMQLNWNSYIGQ